ncbi:MAG: glycosyl transferase [Bacteroidia bacterium]|nr:glycosyl transferase [Bacteroidia bacterium]
MNTEKLNFCTLFNTAYLSRGLALYHSLQNVSTNFHLYVFAFDDTCYNYLLNENLPQLTVVSLNDFEDAELLRIKPTRSPSEYCWTCTASTILYSIKKFNLSNCTYIDADLYFYSDPLSLINEATGKSIIISEHRYTAAYDQSVISGKYCVQFMYFKNNENGLKALNWWRNACIEWCYAHVEDGKFGDQKYLDDWTTRFEGVHVLENLGGGVAPWNVQQYDFVMNNNSIKGIERKSGREFILVFFHFHGVKFFINNVVALTGATYEISKQIKQLLYFPYIQQLNFYYRKTQKSNNKINSNGATEASPRQPLNFVFLIGLYLFDLKTSVKNIFGKQLKDRILHYHYHWNN